MHVIWSVFLLLYIDLPSPSNDEYKNIKNYNFENHIFSLHVLDFTILWIPIQCYSMARSI